jgi:predicted transcriptional regulator
MIMHKKQGDVRLKIMLLLLNTGEDLSVREIARRLDIPVGHVFYHLKKLHENGVLVREQMEEKVFYTPQELFVNGIDDTLELLNKISLKLNNSDWHSLSHCITMFLLCYNSME